MPKASLVLMNRRYSERKAAVERLQREGGVDNLWEAITLFQSCPFHTLKGLKFTYTVKGGEIKIDRKEKAVTKSTVKIAYKRALEGEIKGPKQLGVFGASYIYPIFVRLGVIAPKNHREERHER